jgi:hypothetical protein
MIAMDTTKVEDLGRGAEDNAMMSDIVVRAHKGLAGGGGG